MRNPNENPLSRKKKKKVKHIENPFESIEEGQTVGMDELSPDCCTLTFVQRTRIVLLPYIYDNLFQTYKEWVEMIVHYCGCLQSSLDDGVKEHIKFVVEGNAPIPQVPLLPERNIPTPENAVKRHFSGLRFERLVINSILTKHPMFRLCGASCELHVVI